MTQTAMAWSQLSLYALPDGDHVWGSEVQLLPSGSMFGAEGVLHGLVGLPATPIAGNRCEIDPTASLVIYGVRGTEADQLRPYQDELADQFSAQQLAREA
jgi:hypothetical protein